MVALIFILHFLWNPEAVCVGEIARRAAFQSRRQGARLNSGGAGQRAEL
jgi:hypothetical protein